MSTIITDNPYTFTVADNMSINAVFENDLVINLEYYPYLTSSVGRSITKTINGSSITLQYNRGSAGTSSPAYTFLAWANTDTGAILSTSNPYTFTGSGTINITALTIDNGNPTSQTMYARNKSGATVYYKNGATKAITASGGQSSLYVDRIDGSKGLSEANNWTDSGRTNYGTAYPGNTWSMRKGFIAGYSVEADSGYTYQPKDWFAKNAYVPPIFDISTNQWIGYRTTNAYQAQYLYFHAMDASVYTRSYNPTSTMWPGAQYNTIYIRPGAVGYNKDWLMNFWHLSSSQAANFTFSASLKY